MSFQTGACRGSSLLQEQSLKAPSSALLIRLVRVAPRRSAREVQSSFRVLVAVEKEIVFSFPWLCVFWDLRLRSWELQGLEFTLLLFPPRVLWYLFCHIHEFSASYSDGHASMACMMRMRSAVFALLPGYYSGRLLHSS